MGRKFPINENVPPVALQPMQELISEHEIHEAVDRLASEVSKFYAGKPLTILGVLVGSMMLLADLIRRIDLPMQVGIVQARSYRGTAMYSGELTINADLLPEVRDRDVLLVDDIFDTGRTLAELTQRVHRLGARSVRCAVLLRKAGRQEVPLVPDHIGFEIPDHFVVGYGLDYQDTYRHLRYIAVLEPSDIEGGSAT